MCNYIKKGRICCILDNPKFDDIEIQFWDNVYGSLCEFVVKRSVFNKDPNSVLARPKTPITIFYRYLAGMPYPDVYKVEFV